MYIAHFEYRKKEPERMYFTAKKRVPVKMEFKAEKREPVKFIITKNMKLEVE
jgi:hypothetical protein